MAHRKDRRPPEVRREDALRPSPYLGYDRHALAIHCMSRGAFEIAETLLRRTVWLNPYEPQFKHDLAWCLYKLGRCAEAKKWAEEALRQRPDDEAFRRTLELIEQADSQGHSNKSSGGAHTM